DGLFRKQGGGCRVAVDPGVKLPQPLLRTQRSLQGRAGLQALSDGFNSRFNNVVDSFYQTRPNSLPDELLLLRLEINVIPHPLPSCNSPQDRASPLRSQLEAREKTLGMLTRLARRLAQTCALEHVCDSPVGGRARRKGSRITRDRPVRTVAFRRQGLAE